MTLKSTARRALSAIFIAVLALNGTVSAYQQMSDLRCDLDGATSAEIIVESVGETDPVLCVDGGCHLVDGHCCHAGAHIAALGANDHSFDDGRGLDSATIVDALHDHVPVAPPVPPPNA